MPTPVLIENGALRVRQCRHGLMTYLANDRFVGRSLELYGEYSEGEVALFAQTVGAGHTVIEAGANIGTHTVALARLVGPQGTVIAFEPQRQVFQIMCANLALNRLGNVRALPMGLGAKPGRAILPSMDYAAVGNFGGVALTNEGAGEAVNILSIDSMELHGCHLIKADVEGMEIDVINGAVKTIERFRPVLYLENDRREFSAAMIGRLFELDYKVFWHLPPLFNPANFFGAAENVFGTIGSINLFCLPNERQAKVAGMRPVTGVDDWWKVTPSSGSPPPRPADR